MDRRNFLSAGAIAAAAALSSCTPRRPAIDLSEASVDDLRAGLESGKLTTRALAEGYLDRIATLDRRALSAVIEINPDALAIAGELDMERRSKGPRGPLHGIPVLIKDNIDTADRMSTSAGSLALAGNRAARDSAVAQRLRAAGALILGKTNLSEWANFRGAHSISGWSGRGGQTHNAYAFDRNPGGSSSGSGAAVSASLCAVAVGTETDGSIVNPSSLNGIVGIKPTVGLIGGSGIIPISHTQDTAGPMARTVRDAALLLNALAGVPHPDYAKSLDPRGLKGARIGVARKFFGSHRAVDRLMESALDEMKRQGAELIDSADLPSHGKFDTAEFQVLLYEFKADLNAYLGALGPAARVRSLADVIAFNERESARELPYFGQETMIQAQAKGPLTDKAYLEALETCRKLSRADGIDAVVKEHRLDAIVAPTDNPAWLIDPVNGDYSSAGCSTPAAVAGYPHITVPAGFIQGLPIGLSFFGPAWSEPTLIKLAYAFEQATKARRAPRLLATAPLGDSGA